MSFISNLSSRTINALFYGIVSSGSFYAYNRCGEKGKLPGNLGWVTPASKAAWDAGLIGASGGFLAKSFPKFPLGPIAAGPIAFFVIASLGLKNSINELAQKKKERIEH